MVRSTTFRVAWPSLVSAAACLVFAGARLAAGGGDPVALAEIGTKFSELDPQGSEGYDGQFTYTVATTPDPRDAAPHLDRPAYRYQRILYPWVARVLAMGNHEWIPWALLAVAVASAAAATAAVAWWMVDHGQWEGYALGLGLWVGLIASPGLFLHEALAYALAAVGWLASRRGHPRLGAAALGLALFAKETTAPFWIAAWLAGGEAHSETRRRRLWLGVGGAAFAVWQAWLWATFGEIGLGSGGAMGTAFEIIPLMGFLRIGGVSLEALALFAVIFGPMVILPAVWGTVAGVRSWRRIELRPEATSLILNSIVVLTVPFSTAREPLGLVRLATGLVLAVLFFAAHKGERRVLNYSLFWTSMLVLLARG